MRTERLLMRRWRDVDRDPFAELNADPLVMEHFPAPLDRAASDALIDRIMIDFEKLGFGLWAVERLDTGAFIGFVGLTVPQIEAPFMPTAEVGWRLARAAWGQGFATEAARRAVCVGFDEVGLPEIVSLTARTNIASQAVMHRLGMTHDAADDFEHPSLPVGHRLRCHVLYRLDPSSWRAARSAGGAQSSSIRDPDSRSANRHSFVG